MYAAQVIKSLCVYIRTYAYTYLRMYVRTNIHVQVCINAGHVIKHRDLPSTWAYPPLRQLRQLPRLRSLLADLNIITNIIESQEYSLFPRSEGKEVLQARSKEI